MERSKSGEEGGIELWRRPEKWPSSCSRPADAFTCHGQDDRALNADEGPESTKRGTNSMNEWNKAALWKERERTRLSKKEKKGSRWQDKLGDQALRRQHSKMALTKFADFEDFIGRRFECVNEFLEDFVSPWKLGFVPGQWLNSCPGFRLAFD